jgi:hypothetical protein
VDVSSDGVGTGSTFRVRLPLYAPATSRHDLRPTTASPLII